mgnify:CR=1 FL=1
MICVFDKHTPQNSFDTCGLRILNPTSAFIMEELTGRYDYEISCPMLSDDDSWQFLQPYNIIKASNGQLFQINKVVTHTVNGVPTITAYAPHIWYYLADMCVVKCEDTREAYWTMRDLFTEIQRPTHGEPFGEGTTLFSHGAGLTDYNFSWSVQLDGMHHYKFKNCSLAYAILGAADSVVNLWGGYLHRNNFEFSIRKDRKQDTSDNAFELVYGYNCSDIKCTIDYSKRITEHWGWSQFGQYAGVSFIPDAGTFPRQVISAADYSCHETDYNGEVTELTAFIDDYFAENSQPTVTYDVNYVDAKDTSYEFNGWDSLRRLKVGDSGYVTGLDGRREHQTIISVKYNDITQRIDSLKLGEFIHSPLHETRWDKIISDDTAAYRRLDVLEKRMNYFELIKGDE